jgi:hypothetical protein
MAIIDLRQRVLAYIEKADDRFLPLVLAMTDSYKEEGEIVARSVDGIPLTHEQYNHELKLAEGEIKRGETISLEDLEKEVKNG